MASSSGAGTGAASTGPSGGCRECESCHSAPAVPFCRVEWSYLCPGCAPVVYRDSWIVAVPPFPNPNPNPNLNPNPNPDPNHPHPVPYFYPYMFPNANPSLNPIPHVNPNPNPNKRRRRRKADADGGGGEEAAVAQERVASVMKYKEKRKTRQYNKTVRYETRKAYAELRPRIDGKFTRPESTGEETEADAMENINPIAEEDVRENTSIEAEQLPPVEAALEGTVVVEAGEEQE